MELRVKKIAEATTFNATSMPENSLGEVVLANSGAPPSIELHPGTILYKDCYRIIHVINKCSEKWISKHHDNWCSDIRIRTIAPERLACKKRKPAEFTLDNLPPGKMAYLPQHGMTVFCGSDGAVLSVKDFSKIKLPGVASTPAILKESLEVKTSGKAALNNFLINRQSNYPEYTTFGDLPQGKLGICDKANAIFKKTGKFAHLELTGKTTLCDSSQVVAISPEDLYVLPDTVKYRDMEPGQFGTFEGRVFQCPAKIPGDAEIEILPPGTVLEII